jgi:ABC-type Zn uptake system ZnuABC Zn-binding protein ZnuA
MREMGIKRLQTALTLAILCCILLAACVTPSSGESAYGGKSGTSYSDPGSLSPVELAEGERLRVVATTNIIGDVVLNIGGDAIELTTLLPINADPHAYQPTPGDLQAVNNAHVVFINGLGLEEFLEEMIKNAGNGVPVVSLSEGIDVLIFGEGLQNQEGASEEVEADHDNGAYDPHVWFDPTNVMVWIDRVTKALSTLDPENSASYIENASNYKEQLRNLDEWIFERVSQLPAQDRKLVADHNVFNYFAARYGFDVVGAVIPAFSSAAEPSAQEIADLEQRVRALGVKALFVGMTVNPNTVHAVVEDTGIEMISLYTGSLSDPEGPAGSYIDFMKFDVDSIVNALLD